MNNSIQSFLADIRQHIAADNLPKALKLLQGLLANSPKLDEAIQLSSRFQTIHSAIQRGIVSHENAQVAQNQIRWAFLEFLRDMEQSPQTGLTGLLDEIDQQSTQSAIQQEVEKAISIINSKNVLISSNIQANGNVHIGDIIYSDSSTATTPERTYNLQLTEAIIKAMAHWKHPDAIRLLENTSWLNNGNHVRKVQAFICRSFVGEIGKQLRQLISIGNEADISPSDRLEHYIHKCLDIARRSLNLVNFVLMSRLWDHFKATRKVLPSSLQQALSLRFDSDFEPSIVQQLDLLKNIWTFFREQSYAFPINELTDIAEAMMANSNLAKTCQELQQLLEKSPKHYTEADGITAETSLGIFLQTFTFLIHYRMAAIKGIGYRQVRNDQPRYLHRYAAIGIDNKANVDAERVNYTDAGEETNTVLLYRGDSYNKNVSLFPFVIDLNALTFENGAKICFFSAKSLNQAAILEYRFLGDNSIVTIEKKGIQKPDTNWNELMLSDESRKILNLDKVVDNFLQARQTLLRANNSEIDFDNL